MNKIPFLLNLICACNQLDDSDENVLKLCLCSPLLDVGCYGDDCCVMMCCQVCTEEELEALNRGSKKSEKLRESLMRGSAVPKFSPQDAEATKKATEHKNKLINYDKNR